MEINLKNFNVSYIWKGICTFEYNGLIDFFKDVADAEVNYITFNERLQGILFKVQTKDVLNIENIKDDFGIERIEDEVYTLGKEIDEVDCIINKPYIMTYLGNDQSYYDGCSDTLLDGMILEIPGIMKSGTFEFINPFVYDNAYIKYTCRCKGQLYREILDCEI